MDSARDPMAWMGRSCRDISAFMLRMQLPVDVHYLGLITILIGFLMMDYGPEVLSADLVGTPLLIGLRTILWMLPLGLYLSRQRSDARMYVPANGEAITRRP